MREKLGKSGRISHGTDIAKEKVASRCRDSQVCSSFRMFPLLTGGVTFASLLVLFRKAPEASGRNRRHGDNHSKYKTT